jgi:hypothetical protein
MQFFLALRPWSVIFQGHVQSSVGGCVLCYQNALHAAVEEEAIDDVEARWDACKAHHSCGSELSWFGHKADGGHSGIAEREDTVMLGLGGNSEDVEDDEEGDTELKDVHLLGISGIFSAPSPGGIFGVRRVDPVERKL